MVPACSLHVLMNRLCFLQELNSSIFPLKFKVLNIVIVVVTKNSRISLFGENAVQLFFELHGCSCMLGVINKIDDAVRVGPDIVQLFSRPFCPTQPDIFLNLRISAVLQVQCSCR